MERYLTENFVNIKTEGKRSKGKRRLTLKMPKRKPQNKYLSFSIRNMSTDQKLKELLKSAKGNLRKKIKKVIDQRKRARTHSPEDKPARRQVAPEGGSSMNYYKFYERFKSKTDNSISNQISQQMIKSIHAASSLDDSVSIFEVKADENEDKNQTPAKPPTQNDNDNLDMIK